MDRGVPDWRSYKTTDVPGVVVRSESRPVIALALFPPLKNTSLASLGLIEVPWLRALDSVGTLG